MTKKQIITISIIAGVLALMCILFGAVFCLRNQQVEWVGDRSNLTSSISDSDLTSSAGIRNGTGIFIINKDKAINNLEKAYPYLKVIEIKTQSVVTIKYRVRERVAMYYTEYNSKYYICDEDLKLLEIQDVEPTGLTFIIPKAQGQAGYLGVTANTNVCDFLGDSYYQNVYYNLFTSAYNTVTKYNPETDKYDLYLSREEISALIKTIDFDKGYTLKYSYDRLVLLTSYGVHIDIGKPEDDLEYKVNVCFSTLNSLSDEQKQAGVIKYFYDAQGVAKISYSATF